MFIILEFNKITQFIKQLNNIFKKFLDLIPNLTVQKERSGYGLVAQ